MYLLRNFQSKEMCFDWCFAAQVFHPDSTGLGSFFLFSSPLSHGRFPIRARLHVKISARSVYFRRKTRVARGLCLRACAREQDEERKCKQFHGQHTANLSFSLSARWLQRVEEGKRPLLHHPSSSSVERTYPIQTAAQPCASRAR